MKTGCRSVLFVAGILLMLVSVTSQVGADENAVRVYGATTFAEPMKILGKLFMNEHPGVRVEVLGKTSEFGFLALLNKETDLVMAARKPTVVERRLADQKGVEWAGARVAWERVAVISHPGVGVTELTVDQLRKIYTGEYKNWRDLGVIDQPIMLHSPPYPQDDIAVWFAHNVLSKAEFTSGIIWVETPDFLVQHVSVHKGAIAYLGNLQLRGILKRHPQFKVNILRIRANRESPALSPSTEITKKEAYPLTIPLFLFWDRNNSNKWIEPFARFCKERFQEAVRK